jgi:hypothetical protein
MENLTDVMSRLSQLEVQAQKKGATNQKDASRGKVEYVHFGDSNQQGSYLIVPLPNPVTGALPYVLLKDVKQFKVNKQFGDKTYQYTRKILPAAAFDIYDPNTGRVISPLTNDDLNLIQEATKLWSDLYRKLGGYKKQADRTPEEQRILMDSNSPKNKNYTIFNGYVINRYEGNNLRKVIKSNYGALIVVPSAAMIDSVNENISQTSTITYGGKNDWVNDIYNFDLEHRKGSIMLTVNRQLGYKITVAHNVSATVIDINMSDEEKALMSNNPVENFIGLSNIPQEELSKAPGQRKLFNPDYYKDMISELRTLNAEFDGGMQSAGPVAEPQRGPIQGSIDPFLAANPKAEVQQQPVSGATAVQNAFSQVQQQATHIDPMANNGGNMFGGFGQQPQAQPQPASTPFANPFANVQQQVNNVQQGGNGNNLPF